MERQEHLDYAAVVRDYHASGTKLSLSEWCQREGYEYSKVKKYNKQKYILPELNPPSAASKPTPGFIELQVSEEPANRAGDSLHVTDITVTLSNSLELHLHERPVEDMSIIVRKLIG